RENGRSDEVGHSRRARTGRADAALAAQVSTVDNVERELGRVTTALALGEQLNGGAGRYGTGAKAASLTLAVVPG
ncbi:copper transporter, partial [Nocardia sp. NPDC019255]|uniref:copper transporter n=1 Tax=Nocardia sp. NPDC019255 TaxID=3154591 RepID=UPI0033E13C4D